MERFLYTGNPARVVFGQGTIASLPEEADRLKARRILVLSTPEQASQAADIAKSLGERVVATFSKAQMHTPVEVTADAMKTVERHDIDALLSVGGGSTTGLGKAIALRTDLPQIVVPTTYAGSEATPILGETDGGRKVTRSDPRILPEVIVYDVDLTLTLPVPLSVTSGINAVAHAVEALYAKEANPVVSLMAEEGIGAIVRALPRIHADKGDVEGRSSALYGAWLCGVCLGSVGMALHHKLCHTLGGMFNLPHAQLHTAVLPHAVAYNASATSAAMERLSRALAAPDPAMALHKLAKGLGAEMSLRDLGMPDGSIEAVADQALSNAYWNPRALDRRALVQLLERAFREDEPKLG